MSGKSRTRAELYVRLVILLADFGLFALALYADIRLGYKVPVGTYIIILGAPGAMFSGDLLAGYVSGPKQ